jgi:signal transduction histidine kinase/Tfp pilus assembly protein PilF
MPAIASLARYRVLEPIGEGGLGIVYRVEDQVDHEIRALKILSRAAGPGHLRAEFLALARLPHDNIVRVFDYGVTDEGQDYFTMELVRGRDLRALALSPTSPAFYPLVGGVLRALSFLHARGVVHADVKPSNILCDEGLLAEEPARAAKLVDFGLAGYLSDAKSAAARGTFPYAAPEVYAGRVDARSDLYALGMVLYELCAGRLPFAGLAVADVILAQRRGSPPDPRALRPELPGSLCELILALTEPEPGARLQTADEVLERINEIGGTRFAVATALPHVQLGGTLVGRDRDLADLGHLWDEAEKGSGSSALILGEEGIGKSRLLGELKLRLSLSGGRFYGASATARPGTAYAGLGEIVRALSVDFGESEGTLAARWRAPLLGSVGSVEKDPGSADIESRFALAEPLAEWILSLSRRAPIALFLDDLQAADRGTVDLFGYLARAAPAGRVLVVGAARNDAAAGAAMDLLSALTHTERLSQWVLSPLDRTSVSSLVAQAFGPVIEGVLGKELHRSSGGNPAVLQRALNALAESGAVGRRRGAWVLLDAKATVPPVPDALVLARARVLALPSVAQRVLRTAAVLGERCDASTLAALLGPQLSESDVVDALGQALAQRVVEREPDLQAYVLVPRGLRDELYGALPAPEREAMHRAAAALFEVRSEAGREVSPATLANHYLALGDVKRGRAHALAAAEAHLGALDHHGALDWYQRVAPLCTDPETKAQVAERLGDVRAALGDLEAASRDLDEACQARSGDAVSEVRLARKLAEILRRRGLGDDAVERVMRALGHARKEHLPVEEAACHLTLARVRLYRSEYVAAAEHATAGLALVRTLLPRSFHDLASLLNQTRADIAIYRGDAKAALRDVDVALADADSISERVLADAYSVRGRAFVHAGDYGEAARALERASAVYQKLGYVEKELKVQNNLGAAFFFQGDWEKARASWDRFRLLCERTGEATELVNALNNLGSLLRDQGDLADAMALLERARLVAERVGHAHMGAMILGNRGEVLFRQGDLAGARECYERCLARFTELGARADRIETQRRLCELDLAAGRVEASLDKAIDAAREAREIGLKLEEGALERVAATALRLQGDLDSAAWFVERARGLFTTLGARYERAKVDLEAAEQDAARGRVEEAQSHLARAVETFTQLGARGDLARARERRRTLGQSTREKAAPSLSQSGLEVLLDVARASGRIDLEKLLEIVLDKILEVTCFERGFLLLLDERGRPTERMRRGRNAREFDAAEAHFSGSIVRRVAQSGEAMAVSDIADDAALRDQKSIVALGLRSVMCAPLRRQGRVTGIIYVDSSRLAEFDRTSNLELLEALAAQAAIAIENARLFAEEERKTELMAILAHEIRNPLAGILGYSELLPEEKAKLSQEGIELLARIHRDAQRLKRLVDNILELARVEAGKVDWSMSPVGFDGLLEEVRVSYEPLATKKGVRVVVSAPPDLPSALGNADRLFQVVSNLLGNALKFTPKGGVITLRAHAERRDEAKTEGTDDDLVAWVPLPPDAQRERCFLRADVVDTGPGIPPEQRAQLFEKFAQGEAGKRSSRGVGLGLFISREIVKRHGGTLWVESEPGQGSCFSFRIPIADATSR